MSNSTLELMDDFQQTLDKCSVPTGEQTELKAIVNSTPADIVFDSAHERGGIDVSNRRSG